jgi:hypothetical protein
VDDRITPGAGPYPPELYAVIEWLLAECPNFGPIEQLYLERYVPAELRPFVAVGQALGLLSPCGHLRVTPLGVTALALRPATTSPAPDPFADSPGQRDLHALLLKGEPLTRDALALALDLGDGKPGREALRQLLARYERRLRKARPDLALVLTAGRKGAPGTVRLEGGK